jgi:hypothetical protein
MIITAYPMATHLGTPHLWLSSGIHFEVNKVAAALQQVCESASEIRPWNGAVPRPWSFKHGMTHGERPAEKTFKIL